MNVFSFIITNKQIQKNATVAIIVLNCEIIRIITEILFKNVIILLYCKIKSGYLIIIKVIIIMSKIWILIYYYLKNNTFLKKYYNCNRTVK